ncbi:proteoglycan 4 [Penaeus vannamei]|uniref:Proteoglycan 4 n=1 Tax=Penaeus vannamei TaxID=6689 RepID=A0A423SWW1_PENVA|nr:proteoglycan 4 [Penaeus vannamei]
MLFLSRLLYDIPQREVPGQPSLRSTTPQRAVSSVRLSVDPRVRAAWWEGRQRVERAGSSTSPHAPPPLSRPRWCPFTTRYFVIPGHPTNPITHRFTYPTRSPQDHHICNRQGTIPAPLRHHTLHQMTESPQHTKSPQSPHTLDQATTYSLLQATENSRFTRPRSPAKISCSDERVVLALLLSRLVALLLVLALLLRLALSAKKTRPRSPAQTRSRSPASRPRSPAQIKSSSLSCRLSPAPPRSPAKSRPRSPAQTRPRSPAQTRPRSPAKSRPRSPAQTRPRSPAKSRPRSPAQTRPRSPAKNSSRSPARPRSLLRLVLALLLESSSLSCSDPAKSRPRSPAQTRSRSPAKSSDSPAQRPRSPALVLALLLRAQTPRSKTLSRSPAQTRPRSPAKILALLLRLILARIRIAHILFMLIHAYRT